VPAEIPDGDLVAVIKTWIQAPPDSTPIDFEEVWHLDGSTRKDNAKARFLQVKEHLLKYGLAKENEFTEILGNPSAQGGRPTTTWKMSLNVFKHYISSSQKERGYRTRGKLHQAEEVLEQLAAPEPEKLEEAKPKTTGGEISVFQFPVTNQSIRVIMIDGEPWWVATDVCRVLGYAGNVANRIKEHCRAEGVRKWNTLTNGGPQEVTIIDERNLYRLMGRSDAPNAEPFQDWVYGTVLPSIRKTGGYSVNPITQLAEEELERLAAPETGKPEETKPTDTQDATEVRVPADIPDGDLVAVAKNVASAGRTVPDRLR
jgi:prophage antirepressor-like protein